MAEGIRIQPRSDLNWPGDLNVCVTDHSRPLAMVTKDGKRVEDVKERCPSCGKQHFAKTYLIELRAGAAIVSTTIWDRLQALDDNPFVYANPVAEPPKQLISPNIPRTHDSKTELVEKFVMPLSSPKEGNT